MCGIVLCHFFLAKESLYGEQSDPKHKMKHNAMEIEVLVYTSNNLMGKNLTFHIYKGKLTKCYVAHLTATFLTLHH